MFHLNPILKRVGLVLIQYFKYENVQLALGPFFGVLHFIVFGKGLSPEESGFSVANAVVDPFIIDQLPKRCQSTLCGQMSSQGHCHSMFRVTKY
jgi:hypothetical protein